MCFIKEVLVVEEQHIRETLGQTILYPIRAESFKGTRVVYTGIVSLGGSFAEIEQCALARVGKKILVIEFKGIRRAVARDSHLQLGEVLVEGHWQDLHMDTGVCRCEGLAGRVEILQVVRSRREGHERDCGAIAITILLRRAAGSKRGQHQAENGQHKRHSFEHEKSILSPTRG